MVDADTTNTVVTVIHGTPTNDWRIVRLVVAEVLPQTMKSEYVVKN